MRASRWLLTLVVAASVATAAGSLAGSSSSSSSSSSRSAVLKQAQQGHTSRWLKEVAPTKPETGKDASTNSSPYPAAQSPPAAPAKATSPNSSSSNSSSSSSSSTVSLSPVPASTDSTDLTSSPTIVILTCPGSPGCPLTSPAVPSAVNTTASATPVSPATPAAESFSVTTSPGSDLGPVQPELPGPDEVLPVELLRQLATSAGQLPAATLNVRFFIQGAKINGFNNTYRSSILSTTSAVSETPTEYWAVNLQSTATQQLGRHLLQQKGLGQGLVVTLSIYTYSPQLVWYRLSQAPVTEALTAASTASSAIAAASSSQQQFTSCSTEYCSKLVAAGVPVDPSSIQVNPDYSDLLPASSSSSSGSSSSGTTLKDLQAEVAANQAAYKRVRRYVEILIGPIIAIIVVIILYWQRRRLIACCKAFVRPDVVKDNTLEQRHLTAPSEAGSAQAADLHQQLQQNQVMLRPGSTARPALPELRNSSAATSSIRDRVHSADGSSSSTYLSSSSTAARETRNSTTSSSSGGCAAARKGSSNGGSSGAKLTQLVSYPIRLDPSSSRTEVTGSTSGFTEIELDQSPQENGTAASHLHPDAGRGYSTGFRPFASNSRDDPMPTTATAGQQGRQQRPQQLQLPAVALDLRDLDRDVLQRYLKARQQEGFESYQGMNLSRPSSPAGSV